MSANSEAHRVALVGYGEVGRILAEDLRATGVPVDAYDTKLRGEAGEPMREHALLHGVRLAESHAQAVADATLIVSAVTASQAVPVAQACAPSLRRGAFFLDFNSASPGAKIEAAGLSVTLTSEGLKQLGDAGSGLALTMVMPDPTRAKTALVRDYQAAMRARGVQEFNLGTLESYTNTRVLAEGLERAGADPTRSKLRTALAGIRNLDLGGLVIDYSGQAPYVGSRFVDMGVLNGAGRFVG